MYLATKPPSALDVRRDAAVVGADHLAQVLGVETRGEGRRADEVDEHHRQLAPLGLAGSAARACAGASAPGAADGGVRAARRAAIASSSRAPVADRGDPDLPQSSAVGQPGRLGVDIVVAERLLVLAQAQPAQPSPDVHHRPSRSGALAPWAQSIPSRVGPTRPMAGRGGGGCLGPVRSSPIAGKAVRVAFDGGRLTSDAGVLLQADIERRLGIAERLARCIEDPRTPERVHHTVADMIRFRVLLIAAGYPNANDCDAGYEHQQLLPARGGRRYRTLARVRIVAESRTSMPRRNTSWRTGASVRRSSGRHAGARRKRAPNTALRRSRCTPMNVRMPR